MSVDYSAVIARGFLINESPYESDKFDDDFIDNWVICFDAWDDCGPYLIGCSLGDDHWDFLLSEACRKAGIPIGEIKNYFGVRVS